MLVSSLLLAIAAQQPVQLRAYRDKELNIQFQYPKTWNLRKERYWTVITYRAQSGREVRIQFLPTPYRDTAETWQQLQVDVAKGRGDTVVRQSEEEILGVPLLLTRLVSKERGQDRAVWTGLIYSLSQAKMNFRVVSDPADADEAEKSWRDVLLSLRTEGAAPKPENPGTQIEPVKPPEEVKPHLLWKAESEGKFKAVRAPLRVKLADTGFLAYTPAGWGYLEGKLTNPGLQGTLKITAGRYDSDQIQTSYLNAGGEQLNRISIVTARDEKPLGFNKAAFKVQRLIRRGKTLDGDRVFAIYSGQYDVFGWILVYEGLPGDERTDFKLVDQLVNELSVESGS